MAFIRDNNINYWLTPAENPNLNLIEMLWNELKHFLSTVVKPRNKEELVDGIRTFWSARVTPEKCQCYIGHLQKVLPEVIRWEGRASGHWSRVHTKTKTALLRATNKNSSYRNHQIKEKSWPHETKKIPSQIIFINLPLARPLVPRWPSP